MSLRVQEGPHLEGVEAPRPGSGCAASAPPGPAGRGQAADGDRRRDASASCAAAGPRTPPPAPRPPRLARAGRHFERLGACSAHRGPEQGAASISRHPMAEAGQRRDRGRRPPAAVTGAGGFIGAAVCRGSPAEGAEVIGIDVSTRPRTSGSRGAGAEPRARRHHRPRGDREALADAELVVHTAAYVREWGEMEDFIRGQRPRHRQRARRRRGRGRRARRPPQLGRRLRLRGRAHQDESAHRRAVGIPYIDTKSASDRIAVRRGAVVVRPGDVYGPGSVPWMMRPVELLRSGQMALPGGGDGTMLPVYIDDLVDVDPRSRFAGAPGPRLHGLGRRAGHLPATTSSRLAEVAGRPAAPERSRGPAARGRRRATEAVAARSRRPPAFGRHGITLIDRRGTASNERAREELGWEPEVGLEEGLARSGEWLRGCRAAARSDIRLKRRHA